VIYDLVDKEEPVLKSVSKLFDFQNPPIDPEEFATNLKESMIHHNGIGLSACQVGFPWRVFVAGDPKDPDNIVTMFNPRIVDASEQLVLMEEGCLSYPGLFIKVKRPENIRIRYAKTDGDIVTQSYEGIPARVILHEYDHMDGITFHNRASKFHLDQAKRQKKKLDKIRKRNYTKLSN
jgi:peptide deformylase